MKSLDCLSPILGHDGELLSQSTRVRLVRSILASSRQKEHARCSSRNVQQLNTYAAARADLSAMAKDLFGVVLSGAVKIEIKQTYPLKDAAQAASRSESRKTMARQYCSNGERKAYPPSRAKPEKAHHDRARSHLWGTPPSVGSARAAHWLKAARVSCRRRTMRGQGDVFDDDR